MPPLMIAVGGGGDAITAAALGHRSDGPSRPYVMTYSWDRLLVDPLPGPRSASDFTGLTPITPGLSLITSGARARPPAGSSLPRLAGELRVHLLLLDPTRGTVGLADQITAAAERAGADGLVLVDVGGDVLTDGADPGLRSPLADQLTLAASVRTGIPARLVVAGAGLDGEIPAATVVARLAALHAEPLPVLGPGDVAAVRPVFEWHPSEASGLLAAAAAGHRGIVEVRDAADQVALTDATNHLAAVDAAAAAAVTPARHLTACTTFAEVVDVVRAVTGLSEIDYETRKAGQRAQRTPRHAAEIDLADIDRHAAASAERGADYISTRRLAELLGATTLKAFAALVDVLRRRRPDSYSPSLYRVSPGIASHRP